MNAIRKQTLLAAAVASAFAAPAALAQSSNVTVYGRMNLSFDRYSASDATAGAAADIQSRNRLVDNSSRLGFKGTEDLGNGLQAIFQIESGVTGDASAGAVALSTGALGTRTTFVGLQGKTWGQVLLGRQDVYYGNGKLDEPNRLGMLPNAFENAAAGRNAISAAGATGNGVMTPSLNRADNVVSYISPSFNNFTLKVQYAIPAGEATAAGSGVKNTATAFNLTYDNGPWYAQADWMKNSDLALAWDGSAAATAAGNEVTAWKLGGAYAFPSNTHVGLLYERLKNETGNGAGLAANVTNPNRERNSWAFNVVQAMGNTKLYAKYGKLDDVSGAAAGGSQTGAKHWGLGASYSFSKRTNVNVFYAKVDNDANANYQFISYNGPGAGTNATPVSAVGADPTSFGVGVVHNF